MDEVAQRRLAASMIVQALRALQPLLHTKTSSRAFLRAREDHSSLAAGEKIKLQAEDARTKEQYFEAVESLVWITSSGSDRYFDTLELDPDVCRSKLDLGFYAELALTQYYENQEFMLRMYIAMARYSLQEREKKAGGVKVPFKQVKRFAEDALALTTRVLEEMRHTAPRMAVRGGRVTAVIAALTVIEESPATLKTA